MTQKQPRSLLREQPEHEGEMDQVQCLGSQEKQVFQEEEGGPTVSDAAGRRWKTPFPTSAQDLAQLSPVGIPYE